MGENGQVGYRPASWQMRSSEFQEGWTVPPDSRADNQGGSSEKELTKILAQEGAPLSVRSHFCGKPSAAQDSLFSCIYPMYILEGVKEDLRQ
jgi:hypothetical protein